MVWTKILSKGWIYVIQTIVIIVALFIIISFTNKSGEQSGTGIQEDIRSIREHLDILEEQTNASIELTNGLINNNEQLIRGLNSLESENKRSEIIATELGEDNTDFTRKVRVIQDRALESELIVDEITKLLRDIERENNLY